MDVMSANVKRKNAVNSEKKLSGTVFVNGFNNWLIIMVSIFCASLVFDNYLRFGIIKGPLEIVFFVISLILEHCWLFRVTAAYYALQIALTFMLEKSLAMGLLSEKVGMSLHALSVFFLPTAFIVTARLGAANPFVARGMATYILYVMTKVWSYAYVNSTYRKAHQQEIYRKETEKPLLEYPSNITAKKVIEYMIFTPPIQYQTSYPQRTRPDLKAFLKLCLQLFFAYCLAAFLIVQYILPELSSLESGNGGQLQTLRCVLRIALPMNLLWMLSIYVCVYEIYLPAYAALTGMKNIVFCKDWWNSENFGVFWRKWNLPVHECLKYNVAVPLLRNGYSATTANLVVFFIAGILHEYLNSFPYGVYSGLALLLTLMEIPVGCVSAYITRSFGRRRGNLFVWAYLISIHSLAAVQIFRAYNKHQVEELNRKNFV